MIGGMARVKDLYGKVTDAHTAERVRADGLVDKPGTPTNRTGGAVWGLNPMFRMAFVSTLAMLAVGNWVGVQAAEIHKWIDERGVTHYSDEAPQSSGTAVTQLEISTHGSPEPALSQTPGDYYSIANQWQRMHQERLQQQRLELQRAAAASIARQTEAEPVRDLDDSRATRYVVAYPYPLHRSHGHHYKHRRRHAHPYQPGMQGNKNRIRQVGFPTVN